jgi:hypothetical protein
MRRPPADEKKPPSANSPLVRWSMFLAEIDQHRLSLPLADGMAYY